MKRVTLILAILMLPSFAGFASDIPPQLGELASLAGEWKHTGEVFDQKTGKWREYETSSNITLILAGRYLEETLHVPSGVLGASAMTFRIHYSFDPYKKIYRISVLDNAVGLLDIFEGRLEKGRLLISNEKTTAPSLSDGRIIANRNTILNITSNQFRSEWEASADGGKTWYPLIRQTYVRIR